MGLFVTFSAEQLQGFEKWRQANASASEVMIIEPVSKRRPTSFKVWFEKPVAGHRQLPWYNPIQEAAGKADDA